MEKESRWMMIDWTSFSYFMKDADCLQQKNNWLWSPFLAFPRAYCVREVAGAFPTKTNLRPGLTWSFELLVTQSFCQSFILLWPRFSQDYRPTVPPTSFCITWPYVPKGFRVGWMAALSERHGVSFIEIAMRLRAHSWGQHTKENFFVFKWNWTTKVRPKVPVPTSLLMSIRQWFALSRKLNSLIMLQLDLTPLLPFRAARKTLTVDAHARQKMDHSCTSCR